MSSAETNEPFLNRHTQAGKSSVSCYFTALYDLNDLNLHILIFYKLCSRKISFTFSPCHAAMTDALLQKDLDAIVWHDGIILSESMTSLNPS